MSCASFTSILCRVRQCQVYFFRVHSYKLIFNLYFLIAMQDYLNSKPLNSMRVPWPEIVGLMFWFTNNIKKKVAPLRGDMLFWICPKIYIKRLLCILSVKIANHKYFLAKVPQTLLFLKSSSRVGCRFRSFSRHCVEKY